MPHIVPKEQDLRRAADVLNRGDKVAMLIGAGALCATDEVIQIAELLGAGPRVARLIEDAAEAARELDLPWVAERARRLTRR